MSKIFSFILTCALLCAANGMAQTVKKDIVRHAAVSVTTNRPGTLTIENFTDKAYTFTIYSITGQAVRTVELKNDSTTIKLPQGFYIVKSENGTMKVAVK